MSLLAAGADAFTQPQVLRMFHFLGFILYLGGFLAMTRWMGKAVKFANAESRADTYRIMKRMHMMVEWPGLAMIVVTGLWMFLLGNEHKLYMKQGYFHLKMTCILVLLVVDFFVSKKLFALDPNGPQPKAALFAALHGIAGLALIGILLAVTVIRG